MSDISIRNFSEIDIKKVAELEKECFSEPWSEVSLRAELDKNDSFFFVLLSDEKLSAYIGTNIILDECYIANVAVFKNQRGNGFGKMLVSKAIENAKEKGCSFITLEVRTSNVPAISLYQSFGFENVGKRKNFYSNPTEDAIIMTKYL